jgi:HlyD family secretion protein
MTGGIKQFRTQSIIAGIVLLVTIAVAAYLIIPGLFGQNAAPPATYVVKRENLIVKVLESGSLKAQNSLEIRSGVEGQTKIIEIVPEGTVITEEDVNKKVLVRLESSALKGRLTQQTIAENNAKAAHEQAIEGYKIQLKQNESDIQAGTLEAKFASMDLKKYLGEKLAGKVLQQTAETAENQSNGSAHLGEIDFKFLLASEDLGGEALQTKRNLESEIDLAKEEVSRAHNKLKWTEQLHAKGYVTGDELEADRLSLKRRKVDLERAHTGLDLFLKYEFPKETEKHLSEYLEAARELERIKARAKSRETQADAARKSKELTHELELADLHKIEQQIKNCTIYAPKPGLVIYGSSGGMWWRRAQNPIGRDQNVSENQTIITLPDLSRMSVDVKVHESSVKKVRTKQKVIIKSEAFPDLSLTGEVSRVAEVPDSQMGWLGSDINVYSTEIIIDGINPQLKPGMSVSVEIIVEKLHNVITVPVQAVHARKGHTVCYVLKSGHYEARPVLMGSASETFVQIREGIEEGEMVLLREPRPNERVEDVKPNFDLPENKATQNKDKKRDRPGTRKPAQDKPDQSAEEDPSRKQYEEMVEIMSKFLPEEREKIIQLMQSPGGENIFKKHKPKMEGMTIDEKIEYIRKHILNKE